MAEKIRKSEEEWRRALTPDEFRVLREKGTERPFTGKYVHHEGEGTYLCAACGNPLFPSEAKFESGSGWPSFTRPATESAVETEADSSFGMARTEVLCSRCSSHLGHVFEDGPRPTGLRYCINSVALDFRPAGQGGEGESSAGGGPQGP